MLAPQAASFTVIDGVSLRATDYTTAPHGPMPTSN